MATNDRTTMVGVFRLRSEAERAYAELQRAGFGADQIGFVARTDRGPAAGQHDDPLNMEQEATPGIAGSALTGALSGGATAATAAVVLPAIGPVIAGGILATTMVGVAVGAATGSVLGALANLGLPDNDARYYETMMRSGRTVVIIHGSDRAEEAAAILHQAGAFDVDSVGSAPTEATGRVLEMSDREARMKAQADDLHQRAAGSPDDSVMDREARDRMAWEGEPSLLNAEERELDRRRRRRAS
jgi:hypothetical protein